MLYKMFQAHNLENYTILISDSTPTSYLAMNKKSCRTHNAISAIHLSKPLEFLPLPPSTTSSPNMHASKRTL